MKVEAVKKLKDAREKLARMEKMGKQLCKRSIELGKGVAIVGAEVGKFAFVVVQDAATKFNGFARTNLEAPNFYFSVMGSTTCFNHITGPGF